MSLQGYVHQLKPIVESQPPIDKLQSLLTEGLKAANTPFLNVGS